MLALSHVHKSFAGEPVLVDVSLAVKPGARIGVVGPNGIGKSTLLRVLAGLEEPDAGTVTRSPAGLRVGYLPQEPDARPDETLRDYLARRTSVADAERELDRLTRELAADPSLAAEHAQALEAFLTLGGDDFEARARAVCAEVGLAAGLGAPTTNLSGGECARAALAAILLSRFDVHLLDEPTNDLDFEGLDRLERFLSSLRASLVIVSHDRELLDRTVSRIVEVEEGTRRIREFPGGWSEYERARSRTRAAQSGDFQRYDEQRRYLDEQRRVRRGEARAGGGMANRRGTKALASKVRAVERRLERLDPVEKPWQPWELHLELAPDRRGVGVVVRLEGAVVERPGFRLGPTDLEVRWGERVVVAGPNGSGKTTLLGAVLGRLPLTAGRRYTGPGVVFGELDQTRSRFAGGETVLAAFRNVPVPDARSLLAKFGLGADDVSRPAASLSPGERTRAELALMVAGRVNCLVLDEPTNHLDLPGIEELEAAVTGYPGAVVVVSHDRRFLSAFEATQTVSLAK